MRLLPQFPLGIVVFPGENLNLHIFEPRYRQLIADCNEDGSTFGVTTFLNGKLCKIGTEVSLIEISTTHEDGRMDIRTKGGSQYTWDTFLSNIPEKLYAGADVTLIDEAEQGIGNPKIASSLVELIQELYSLLEIEKEPPFEAFSFRTFEYGHYVGFTLEQEYELLTLREEEARQKYMTAHLTELLKIQRKLDALKRRAALNGHFKELDSPF